MKTIKKILTITAFALSLQITCFAGQYAKQLFARARTIAGVGLCAWAGADLSEYVPVPEELVKMFHSFEDVSPNVRNFVHGVMEREGVAHPRNIRVYAQPAGHVVITVHVGTVRGIALDEDIAKQLDGYLYGNKNGTKNDPRLAFHRSYLSHEAAHLKSEHKKKRIALMVLSTELFLKMPKPAGLLRLLLTGIYADAYFMLNAAYWRQQEFDADNAVARPEEIRAAIEHYTKYADDTPPQDPLELFIHTAESLHSTHPRNYERLAHFEDREKRLVEQ